METLDSGIGSRSPTPDNNLSHMNSSKATKVATISNHINNNSHTDSDGTYKSKSKDRGDANQVPEATATVSANGTEANDGGGNETENTQGNTNTTSSNGGKTYSREFNRHSSTHHGQYKKYNGNPHYSYGHNMHYRYGNGPRRYGNKHHFNSNGNYNHHNQHYQGQNYHHQQYQQSQEHFHHSRNGTAAANSSGSSTGTSNSSSHPHSHHQQHHNGTQGTQYFNSHVGTGTVAGLHRNATPQVFISSDQVDNLSWGRRGGETTNTNWSSPSLETESASSAAVPISLNVSLVNNNKGFYSPSPQNASPAISPSTTDSSDGYSLQEETSTGLTVCSTARQSSSAESLQYTTPSAALVDPLGSNGAGTTAAAAAAAAATYSYAPLIYHPSGVYAAYTSTNNILAGNGTRSFSNGIPPFYNPGLLMTADSSNYALVKADSSINSNNSDKTLEWTTEDGIIFNPYSVTDRGEEIFGPSGTSLTDRSTNATSDYFYAPLAFTSSAAHFPPANKKRFYNGPMPGKLSPVPQNHRYHYPRKLPAGFPREWHDDLDPEYFVSAFSKFGEVKERPPQLAQNPQPDSLSEGIWLKFLGNQQTTETFRKKMELWRDIYRILRTLNINSNFKHDPRNFPTFGLQVVGSTMSGFGSNTSDVDMCLLVRGSDVDQRYEAVDKLQVLYGALSATQWLDNVELIYAKVPILKFRDPKRFLEVDLNCNNFVGIRNTHLLYCYSQADWRLKPLVLVVKLWAHHHGINDAKNMTISSYSLVLMVIHFLQCGVEDPVLPSLQQMYPEKFSNTRDILSVRINEVLPPWQSKNQENIGNLLIQFLEYYALKFDYSENAVSVRIGGTIPIKQAAAHRSIKNDPHQWKYLCIEEPFDRTNTARSVYDRNTFDRILGIFNLSYQRLLASRNLESIFTQISETDARTMSVLIR